MLAILPFLCQERKKAAEIEGTLCEALGSVREWLIDTKLSPNLGKKTRQFCSTSKQKTQRAGKSILFETEKQFKCELFKSIDLDQPLSEGTVKQLRTTS